MEAVLLNNLPFNKINSFCKKYILFFILFIAAESVSAQGGGYAVTKQIENIGYSCKIYNATNGLLTSDANYILGSRNGFVWLCSYNGVVRYDGSNFEQLPTSTGLTSGRAFFEDSLNRIWVGTNDNGVVVIDGENTRHYTYKDGLPSSSIRHFAEDKNGNIFVATTSGLAFIKENGLIYTVSNPVLDKERILKLDCDSAGTIYGQTTNGIVFKIKDRNIAELYTSSELGMERITSILADPVNPGNVYLCAEDGFIYYGAFGKNCAQLKKIDISPIKTVQWISYDCSRIWVCSKSQIGYLDLNNKLHLVKNLPMNSSIEMLTSDYQGNIWCCSSTQGVMKIVANNFVNITEQAALPVDTVNATCLHNGMLYIGTEKGLFIVDKDRRQIKNALTDYIADSRIRCISEDNNKNIWIGTFTNGKGLVCQTPDGKISSFTTSDGMADNRIRVIKVSKDGSILCGTNDGFSVLKNMQVVKTIGKNEVIKNTIFLTVEETYDGKILIGSDGDGIYSINGSVFQRYGREEGLTSDVILRIKEDKRHGVIWIVTSNSIQYMRNGIIVNVTSFPYNNNYDVYFTQDNDLWVLASSGIYSVSAESMLLNQVKEYSLYTVANGLPSTVTSNSNSSIDNEGNLYICCREGVSCVNVNGYLEQTVQPKTSVNSIYCGSQKIHPDENGVYILPPTKDRVKLTASVMDYTMANPFVHLFLEGAKDDGITVRRDMPLTLEYSQLSYGNYKLHVQILNNTRNGIYVENVYKITKKPRITELFVTRILFILVLIIVVGFAVWRFMSSTVISRQYRQIQSAKEEAERANKTKTRFLSNISQEIITPINTIMCMNEMLLRENANDVPNSYFLSIMNYGLNIKRASDSLLNLINDLLEMTRIESGKLVLSESEYCVQDFLRSVIVPVRIRSIEKELKFTVSIDKMIPSRLYGDVGKIKQILHNLLSNAVKYTEQGGFELFISMENRTNDVCDLCIRVKDTGIGIKPEIIESLFDVYGSYEKKNTDYHLKTGLGLDISRKFAELMGGVLVCRSELGKGSEFIFTLTQKIIDKTPMGEFTEQEDIITRGPYIPQFIAPDADILVASENAVNLNVLDNLLKATKVFVTKAVSRQEFIEKLSGNSYNVAFIDLMLFENDESLIDDFIFKMKEINNKIPVYLFMENSSEDEDLYKSKGFAGSLSVPFDPDLLERTIMRNLPEEMMELPDKNTFFPDLEEIPENMRWLYDTEGLCVEEGIKNSGGIGGYLFSLKLFLDTISENARVIDNAYLNGDYNVYRLRNGIIRNSARIIGASALYDFSSRMETALKHEDKIFVAANTDKLLAEYTAFKQKLEKLNQNDES